MRGRISFLLLVLLLLFAAMTTDAFADKRVALVIGNSTYLRAPKLPNPVRDAAAVSALLQGVGFDTVETYTDLRNADMRRVVRDFSDRAREADIAIVFFAGHGVEVRGSNFLIPVDATLDRDLDVEDEALALDRVLQMIEPAKRLRLVILDACRDNPFIPAMKRTMASRTMGRGLARVEPTSPNTLIAFAAKDGSTAADGDAENSPFTQALLKYLAQPGLDLRLAFGKVRDDVLHVTNSRQEPFLYGSLGGSTVALVAGTSDPAVAVTAPAQSPPVVVNFTNQARDFELTATVGTKEAWDAFLLAHPNGLYADLARAQRTKLLAMAPTDIKQPTPAKAAEPVAQPEPARRERTFHDRTSRKSKQARNEGSETRGVARHAAGGRDTGGAQPEHCDNIRRALSAARAIGWNTNAGLLSAGKRYCHGG